MPSICRRRPGRRNPCPKAPPAPAQTAETPAATTAPADTPAPAPAAIKITARALSQEYQANEVAADGKYKGKMLEVTGKVEAIGKDILDDPYVALAGADLLATVQFGFTKADNEQLAQLSKGRTITIRGECRGLILTMVTLDDSEIIQ